MELYEKTLEQVSKYEGRVIHVHVDTVELPNGRTSTREIVNHPGGVGILALDENNNVLVVRQYRYAFGRTLLEIPAGKLEKGEDPYQAAMRELKEETGATCEKLQSLGEIFPTPGYCDEIIRLYLARNLSWGEMHLDEDEFLTVSRMPFQELVDKILSGEIRDAKTCAAILKAKLLLDL